ncbi:hypothetical protein [Flindersiella endophytica]
MQAIWDLGPRPEEWPNSEETPSPSFISDPVRIPGGRLIHIDFHDLPASYRIRLPEALTDVLAGHGITDALVEAPARLGDRYLNLDRFTPLVRTWLHDPRPEGAPRFTTRPSEALVEVALAWLREARQEQDQLIAVAGSGVEIPLSWSTLHAVVDDLLGSPSGRPTRVMLLSTDFADRAFAAELGTLNGYGVLLTEGRSDWTRDSLAAHLRRRRELIRELAHGLEWAGVMLDYTAFQGRVLTCPHQFIGPDHLAAPLWYQLLSSALVRQLGGVPEGGVPCPGGGAELTVGEPESWIR